MMIGEFILEKEIGKGKFSTIYLSRKKIITQRYVIKEYERKLIEKNNYIKYMKNSIIAAKFFNHPNIIKANYLKKTPNNIDVIYEYCNGGNLSHILEKYQQKYINPFPPIIIQHFMRQIVQAFIYIHKFNLIHRNIKLKNFFVNFDTEQDKENLNLIKATIKVSGFKHCIKSSKNLLMQDISNINKCPSQKKDIFDLGLICYTMIFGKNASYYNDMEVFINDIEKGKIVCPLSLSKEMLSFLKCMLRNNSTKRLKIEELYNHEFLRNDIRSFKPINPIKNNFNPLISTTNGYTFSNNIYI